MNKQEIEINTEMAIKILNGTQPIAMDSDFYYKKAIDLAISTLEKQISKKPKVMETTLVGEKFWWYCGHCGASLHTNTKHNYCSYCGGKTDWRNKDE